MIVVKIFFRLLSLPFIMGISLLAALRNTVMLWVRWVCFGGELMTWDKEFNPNTIANLLTNKINQERDGDKR